MENVKVEISGNRVRVYINEKLIISHSPSRPFVSVAKGDFAVQNGRVRDITPSHTPLINSQYDKSRSLLRFFDGGFSVSFHITEENGRLRLSPRRASTGLNRMKLSFFSAGDDAIYGAGAQKENANLCHSKISLAKDSTCPFPAFFTESNTYYIFATHSSAEFDFRQPKKGKRYNLSFWELPSSIIVGNGENATDCILQITKICGGQSPLPRWVFDGAMVECMGGKKEITQTLNALASHNANISSVYIPDWTGTIDAFDETHPFYDWTQNHELYPKLPELIASLEAKDIHAIAYLTPHFSIEGKLFAEASSRGNLVQKPEGGNLISDMGGFMAGHLDLTNPKARGWFTAVVRKNLLDIGFSGFCADKGEYLPPQAVLHSSQSAADLQLYWSNLWVSLCSSIIRDAGRVSNAFFFTTCGKPNIPSQLLSVKPKDKKVKDFSEVLISTLSLACSGLGLSMPDCGNAEFADRKLLLYWLDFIALSPVQKIRSEFCTDDELLEHIGKTTRLHTELSPYIRLSVQENIKQGLPVVQPLFTAHKDVKLRDYTDGYMLGSELVCYPVLREKTKQINAYLPDGVWRNLWTGEDFEGGGVHNFPLPEPGRPLIFFKRDGKNILLFDSIRQPSKNLI